MAKWNEKLSISPTVATALECFKMNAPVTPSEINAHVGDGDYAAKHVWYLRKFGFVFSVQKDGRKIASYTLIQEPDDVALLRSRPTLSAAKITKVAKATAPKAPKVPKAPKAKAPKKVAAPAPTKKVAAAKKSTGGNAANLAKLKQVAKKFKKEQVEAVLNEDVPATTFSIDNDWDSIDGIDLSKLI
jgi:hypothetical protein